MTENIDYKELFESMPVPQFIVNVEEKDRYIVVAANQVAQDFFASVDKVSSENGILGMNIEDFVQSDDLNYVSTIIENVVETKKASKIKSVHDMDDGFRISGFWLAPLLNEEGEVTTLNVIASPASKQSINLQQERDDAISLLTSVFDVSEVGIVVTDQNSRIVRVNDSFVRIYGWKRDDLVGHEFAELIAEDEREQAKRTHDEFLKSGIRSSGEMKILRSNGEIANALFTTAVLELSQGRKFQITTIMDITLRKQMELSLRLAKEQADSANHAKSTFLANMSHELRTPLNAILGFSEMMIKETFGPLGSDKYSEYLDDIHLSAEHLLEIINEVLDMSKIEAGRVELDEEFFNIGDLIESVERMMASRAFSARQTITQSVEDDLPLLFADPRLVRQILINLVGNAVKYCEDKGEIDVAACLLDGGELRIVVKDEGVGIPKDKIKEALEPFGQVNMSAESQSIQGTGLGLPLAKAMTELHGGSLAIESDTGMGTKAIITFPPHRFGHAKKEEKVSDDEDRSPFSGFTSKTDTAKAGS